jgi:hypothetical protein
MQLAKPAICLFLPLLGNSGSPRLAKLIQLLKSSTRQLFMREERLICSGTLARRPVRCARRPRRMCVWGWGAVTADAAPMLLGAQADPGGPTPGS